MISKKKPLFVANWKMNLNIKNSVSLFRRINTPLSKKGYYKKAEIAICPSFMSLWAIKNIKAKKVKLGAQDVFWKGKGAFTGETSPLTLKEAGCKYVIVGHSERRENLWESDQMVNDKVKTVLKNDLIPIICVGETFEERKRGLRDSVITRQVERALEGIRKSSFKKIVIAYEPVWVIGIGQAVLPEDASYSHFLIKKILFKNYPEKTVDNSFKIIYGGSINEKNINSFLMQDEIDGVLVGSASLDSKKFIKMMEVIDKRS